MILGPNEKCHHHLICPTAYFILSATSGLCLGTPQRTKILKKSITTNSPICKANMLLLLSFQMLPNTFQKAILYFHLIYRACYFLPICENESEVSDLTKSLSANISIGFKMKPPKLTTPANFLMKSLERLRLEPVSKTYF